MARLAPYNPQIPAMYAYWSVLAQFTDPKPKLPVREVADIVMRALAVAFRRMDTELEAACTARPRHTARAKAKRRPVLAFRRRA